MHKTSKKNLSKRLTSLNISPSSIIMIHSSLLRFGIFEGGVEGFFNCIMDSLRGDCTVLMPAFNSNFEKTRKWFACKTKSEAGILTEYFRGLPNTVRTIHPFHSVIAYGKFADDFLQCRSRSSFGKDSVFDLLLKLNAYNLSLGVGFVGGATFVHHVEEVCQVPYRHYKEFPGDVYDLEDKRISQVFRMYVRKITDFYEYENNWERAFKDLSNENCFQIDFLNIAEIMLSSIKYTSNILMGYINEDPFYAARKVEKK